MLGSTKFTIVRKSCFGFGVLILMMTVTGLVITNNLSRIDSDLTEMNTVKEPLSAAAYEMEINVIGTGMGIFKYLETADPSHRERVAKDHADFVRFKAEYDRLAETPRGKEMGSEVGRLYQEYHSLGDSLMAQKDTQDVLFARIGANFEKSDDILDEQIQANIDESGPNGIEKVRQAAEMEVNIAEVGTWLGNYLRIPSPEYGERIQDNVNDFRRHLAAFKRLRPTTEEKRRLLRIEGVFEQTTGDIEEVLALSASIREDVDHLIELRRRLDGLLDEDIQVSTRQQLAEAKLDAQKAVSGAQRATWVMLLAGLAVGIGAAAIMLGSIAGPLRKLTAAAEEIGRGKLEYRVEHKAKDEFGTLASAFNLMAERRRQEEEKLQEAYRRVEEQVEQRTAELGKTNQQLQLELAERKRTEAALRESEERFRDLFDQAPIAYHEIDRNGVVQRVNQAECALLGLEPSEILGRSVWDLQAPDQRELSRQETRRKISEKQSVSPFQRTYVSKDGGVHTMEIHERLIREETGEAVGIRSAMIDITKRVEAENESERLEAQVRHAQKLESLGVLAGGIAHDFNNLLVGILGNAGLARMDLPPESKVQSTLQEIEAAGQRAADLTNQLLAYSGKGRFVVEPLDLSKLTGEMAHLLKVSVSIRASMEYELASEIPPIEGDATQIRQVVMNLIINASEATAEEGGVVRVSTGVLQASRQHLDGTVLGGDLAAGSYVYFRVNDNGQGMDEETMAKIFDPFFTTKFTGRGLGLAAVLGIVRGHRGTIEVITRPGAGTTFCVLFPASMRPADGETPAAPVSREGWARKGKVLVVDDDESVREVARAMLENCGFGVLTAGDGRQGVEVFRDHADETVAVLLDLTMPGMQADETVRELRLIRPNSKVILSSGYSEEEVTAQLGEKDIAGFIQEPYKLSEFSRKVREIVGTADAG